MSADLPSYCHECVADRLELVVELTGIASSARVRAEADRLGEYFQDWHWATQHVRNRYLNCRETLLAEALLNEELEGLQPDATERMDIVAVLTRVAAEAFEGNWVPLEHIVATWLQIAGVRDSSRSGCGTA